MFEDRTQLLEAYENKRDEIKRRLEEFKEIFNQSDERIFAELAFCLCTPQSRATVCWRAIEALMKNNLLYEGSVEEIRPFLNTVRFGGKKSEYIVSVRQLFTENGELRIKKKIKSFDDIFELRKWLVENVKGLGYKESTHFLRNIGLGRDLAILDRHILRNLKKLGIINEVKTLTDKKYLDIENKMRKFSEEVGITMNELDLLFWSEETGQIFK